MFFLQQMRHLGFDPKRPVYIRIVDNAEYWNGTTWLASKNIIKDRKIAVYDPHKSNLVQSTVLETITNNDNKDFGVLAIASGKVHVPGNLAHAVIPVFQNEYYVGGEIDKIPYYYSGKNPECNMADAVLWSDFTPDTCSLKRISEIFEFCIQNQDFNTFEYRLDENYRGFLFCLKPFAVIPKRIRNMITREGGYTYDCVNPVVVIPVTRIMLDRIRENSEFRRKFEIPIQKFGIFDDNKTFFRMKHTIRQTIPSKTPKYRVRFVRLTRPGFPIVSVDKYCHFIGGIIQNIVS